MNKRRKIYSLADKLHLGSYFNTGLILAMDLAVSVISSFIALALIDLPASDVVFTRRFIPEWLGMSLAASLLIFLAFRTYRSIIRYSTLHEIGKICWAIAGKEITMGIVSAMLPGISTGRQIIGLLLLDFFVSVSALILMRVIMYMVYDLLRNRSIAREKENRVLVYGTGDKSVSQIMRLRNSPHYHIKGFLTYGKNRKDHILSGLPVYYFKSEDDLRRLVKENDIDTILFAYYADARSEQKRLLPYCRRCGLKSLIVSIDEMPENSESKQLPVRELRIEDLLGRPEIKISLEEIKASFAGKTIMVTGAAGSIGSELCRQLVQFGIRELVMYDNAETPLHNLRLEFEDKYPEQKFTPVIGDVRIPSRLDFVFRTYRPQIVFHAAAYKHVPLMEENPCEAVLVNVVGSRNVADKCLEYDVERMVMRSTDKAVNPTSIMGCTKRLAEIYVQSLGLAIEKGEVQGTTKYITTRFGNVLGSNGSVIPRFREQIAHGGPVTVTHPEITRYFMTIPEACRLVMEAATISAGNEICVFDMGEPVKITHLAEQMIELSGLQVGKDIEIKYTGLRPGEKLYEEVLASAENTRPTSHDRIRIAKVREYEYDNAKTVVDELETLSRAVNIPDMVRLMKHTVPEYNPENSRFKELDEKQVG